MHNIRDISVVIPSKDRVRLLQKAVTMYLQRPEVKEIVVVNDGSTDGTADYLQDISAKEPRVKYVHNEVNRGLPASRNIGLAAATGEYVFSTEDDVEIAKDFFTILFQHYSDSGADIMSGRDIFKYEDELPKDAIRRTDKLKGPSINKKVIEVKTGMNTGHDQEQPMLSSPMFSKTEVFRKVKFDEKYRVNFWREETDMQISAVEQGYKLVFCPHAISFNFVIIDDRSGLHASVGLKRAMWIIRNNWYFINKHKKFVNDYFELGNLYVYFTKFSIRYILIELFVPPLAKIKWKILKLTGKYT